MARARNIKPSFFTDDNLAENDPLGRILFIGLWTLADFKGCLEYKPKRLKVQLLPYDECDIEQLVINLDKSGFIAIYSVQGQPYIKVLGFEEHQNPHPNEKKKGSSIPDLCDADKPVENKSIENNGLKNITINHDQDGTDHDQDGTDRADSLLLIPDSPILIPEGGVRDTSNSDEFFPSPKTITDDFEPDDNCKRMALMNKVDIHIEKQKFIAYYQSKDEEREDWQAAFRAWIVRAAQYNAESAKKQQSGNSQDMKKAAAANSILSYQPEPAEPENLPLIGDQDVIDGQYEAI